VPLSRAFGADRDRQRPPGADEHDKLLGPGDARVQQVALQHHPRPHGERDDHGWVLAALRPVDGDRVGVTELVKLVEPVVDGFVFVREHGQLVVLGRHAGDHSDGAVEDARGALLVVVAQLRDLVPDAEHPPAVAPLGLPFTVGRERLLQQQVQVPCPCRAAVHRAEHLHVAARVQAEPGRDAPCHDVNDQLRGLLAVVAAEPEEVAETAERGLITIVDPVRVDHDP
jgi:hypothetical protein